MKRKHEDCLIKSHKEKHKEKHEEKHEEEHEDDLTLIESHDGKT